MIAKRNAVEHLIANVSHLPTVVQSKRFYKLLKECSLDVVQNQKMGQNVVFLERTKMR